MFAETLKNLRKKKNLTQKKLAELLYIDCSTVTKWETGKSFPDFKKQMKLAEIFNVSVDYLLGTQPTPEIQEHEIPDEKTTGIRTIPVLGEVAGGIPIDMVEDIQGYEQLREGEYSPGRKYFGLKIKGESMEPTIPNNSTVIVRQQSFVDNGDIAIVTVNGYEATCKKVFFQNNGILLQPLNQNFEPLFFTNEQMEAEPIVVLGKVIEVRTKF